MAYASSWRLGTSQLSGNPGTQWLGISRQRTDLESRSHELIAKARQAAASDEGESPEARSTGARPLPCLL
eukprot:scaffold40538_cov74-Phaeocystis_antarctica.AAC.2